jgi:hypothetical protein
MPGQRGHAERPHIALRETQGIFARLGAAWDVQRVEQALAAAVRV